MIAEPKAAHAWNGFLMCCQIAVQRSTDFYSHNLRMLISSHNSFSTLPWWPQGFTTPWIYTLCPMTSKWPLLWLRHNSLPLTLTMCTFSGQCDASSNDEWVSSKMIASLGLLFVSLPSLWEDIAQANPLDSGRGWGARTAKSPASHEVCDYLSPGETRKSTHLSPVVISQHPANSKTCEK